MTWAQYGQDPETNISDLHARVQAGRYRPRPAGRGGVGIRVSIGDGQFLFQIANLSQQPSFIDGALDLAQP